MIDFEGFKHKKSEFIIKELSVCSKNYNDLITFEPPVEFHLLTNSEQKAYNWVYNFLHGLSWNSGDYPYKFLQQIIISVSLRLPETTLFAKGSEKCKTLSNYFQKEIKNLEDLNCPRVDQILHKNYFPFCNSHSKHLPIQQIKKHCAFRKSKLFYHWLKST